MVGERISTVSKGKMKSARAPTRLAIPKKAKDLSPDFEGIWLFWKHDLNDFDHLAASKGPKA